MTAAQVLSPIVERLGHCNERQHPAKTESDAIWIERKIDYILTTANNWKGPIGKFHLTVITDPEDILVTCYPGLKQTDPTHYEVVDTDYHPTSELKLLILQLAR